MADQSSKFTIIFGVNTATAIAGLRRFGTQATLAMAGITAALTAATKGAINTADEIGKMAQKIGTSVKDLSGLAYAGKLADASLQDLQVGFRGLNKAINENSESLQRLRIDRLNADNTLRSSYDVLLDVADAFAQAEDGAGKSAIAVDLFGKSGENLIPLLNQGRKGIEDQVKEGEKLGVVFGEQLAKQAEEFNDNLTRLKANLEGIGLTIANSVLPKLNELINKLSQFNDQYGDSIINAIDSTLAKVGINMNPSSSAAIERSGFTYKPKGRLPFSITDGPQKGQIANNITERERIQEEIKLLEMRRKIQQSNGGKSEEVMRNQELSYLAEKNRLLKNLKDSYGQPPFGAYPFNPGDVGSMSVEAQRYNDSVVPIAGEMGANSGRMAELQRQGGFRGRFQEGFSSIANAAGDIGARGAEVAVSSITAGVEGLGDAITGVITGAKNWAQVWQGVTSQIISMVVQMIIKFTILQGLMKIFGFAAGGAGGAVGASFVGPMLPGRAVGGTMLPGGLYQTGEKGTEYAVTSRTLSRLGVGHFQALESGMNPGGKGGGSAPIIIVDSRAKANSVNESMGLRGIIREIMSEGIPAV